MSQSINKKNILKGIKRNSKRKLKQIKEILNIEDNYTINLSKNNFEINILKGNEKILSGNFKFLGIIKKDGTFNWPYLIPGVDKRIIKDIEKIKESKHLFQNSKNKEMQLYYSILSQDSILLTDNEIEKLNDLLLYLSDGMYFFNTLHKSGNLQLIYLTDINEKFV